MFTLFSHKSNSPGLQIFRNLQPLNLDFAILGILRSSYNYIFFIFASDKRARKGENDKSKKKKHHLFCIKVLYWVFHLKLKSPKLEWVMIGDLNHFWESKIFIRRGASRCKLPVALKRTGQDPKGQTHSCIETVWAWSIKNIFCFRVVKYTKSIWAWRSNVRNKFYDK